MKKLSTAFALAAALTLGAGPAMAVTTTTQPVDGTEQAQPETLMPEMEILPSPVIIQTPQGPALTDRVPMIREVKACTADGRGNDVTLNLEYFVGLSQEDMDRDGTTIAEFMAEHQDEINAGIDAVWEATLDKHGFEALTSGSPEFGQDLMNGLNAFFQSFEESTGMTMGMQISGISGMPGCADDQRTTPLPRHTPRP